MNPSAESIRSALIAALPSTTSLRGSAPERRHVYVPPSHVKALHLENSLVIGGRGVGKSFWAASLVSDDIRKGSLARELPLLANTLVKQGYGEKPSSADYPDMDTFGMLLSLKDVEPYHVWRAVVARALEPLDPNGTGEVPRGRWEDTVTWVKNTPEFFMRLLEATDEVLNRRSQGVLLVFDALDRTSNDWKTMDRIVRDLLRVTLQLETFDNLHGKVFLREDQFHGRDVTDFPDASKLTANRVELAWRLEDLHGLLWQYLVNAPGEHGNTMRCVYQEAVGSLPKEENGVWLIDKRLKRDQEAQRKLFIALAGPWMGRNRRRGHTYTWIVGHLADSRGLASPRSFLVAVRAAAEDSSDRYPDHEHPLHYESIKRGVQKASEIRVDELSEDYPWIKRLLEPLSGMTVPCERDAFFDQWRGSLGDEPSRELFGERLPPEHWELGWSGILDDLVELGIFENMKDGRVNMPDLYRIGFGLGRRGGVRPISQRSAQRGT